MSFVSERITALYSRTRLHRKGRELLMDMLPRRKQTSNPDSVMPLYRHASQASCRGVGQQLHDLAYDPQIKQVETGEANLLEMGTAEARGSIMEL